MNDAELRALIEAYSSYVYTIVWSCLHGAGTREDADECVSDVFAEVWLHRQSAPPDNLRAYIGAVARNQAVSRFRQRTAHGTPVSLDDEHTPEPHSGEDIAAGAEAAAIRQILLDCVASLGEPDARIVMQYYFYRRTAREIAGMLGMKPAAVRQRLHRAAKRLRVLLEEQQIKP